MMIKLVILLLSAYINHPVHVSMSSLYMNEGGEYRLSVRMYTDDLNLDLYRIYDAEGTYNDNDHMFVFTGDDSYYERYINDNLVIDFGGDVLNSKLVEKEVLDLETILHFKVDISSENKEEIKINNLILTGLYPDQVNLFIIKLFNKEEGVRFTANNTEKVFGKGKN